ncbi:MAG: hypothetical protein PVI90_04650 [Desulfobacteraceae bacterium]
MVNDEDIIVAGETWSDNFPYVTEKKGSSDTFVCRFNADDDPSPLPSGRPGHWRSNNATTFANTFHLDINICEDGYFEGMWRMYYCLVGTGCFIDEGGNTFPPYPVFGNIDFENQSGTITLDEGCADIAFKIEKQTQDHIRIIVYPDDADENCALDSNFYSNIYYKEPSADGTCEGRSESNAVDGSDGGSGSGGCFVNAIRKM